MKRLPFALPGLGGLLVCLTAVSLMLHISGSSGATYTFRMSLLVGLMMAAVLVYGAAGWMVVRYPLPAGSLWLILGVAILLRAILLPIQPFLSSDIYRYVWDGRVQAAGINPYCYVPADPALAGLRDHTVFPMINRPDYARTIYPPMAQLVFAVMGRVWDSVVAMKIAMVAFETLGIVCMLLLLPLAGLPRQRILLYAWNPLPLWSFAGDGHVDAIAVGLLGLALLSRARHRDGWAGALLAGATLVKFFPIVVAPAFLRGGRFWKPVLAGAVVILGLYALYSSAGAHVLGFLPSYGNEEGLDDGTGFWLLAGMARLGRLPSWSAAGYIATAAAAILVASIVILRRRPMPDGNDAVTLCRDSALLIALTMVAVSAHYSWYFAWLSLPCVVAPSLPALWLSSAPLLLYLHPWDNDFFVWPSAIYVPALALLAVEMWMRRKHLPAKTSRSAKALAF